MWLSDCPAQCWWPHVPIKRLLQSSGGSKASPPLRWMVILLQLNGFQGFLRNVNSERRRTNTQCSRRSNQPFHWDFIKNCFTRAICTMPNQIDNTLFHKGRSGPHIILIHCDNCLKIDMQSTLAAHYCFSAEIITMKNKAGYWLRVDFFFFSSSFIYVIFYSPPSALQFYLSRSLTGGWMYEAQRRRA